jgi:MFS family permease
MVTQAPEAFGRDYGALLAIGTAMFVVYGLGALPMGWLAERLGRKGMMAGFFLGTGGAMVVAGCATGPWALGIALAVMGGFAAIYHPIGTAMLVEAAGEKVGRTVGINGAFGNFGVAAAPVVTALLAARLGWGWAFILPGAASVGIGLLYLREPALDMIKAGGGKRAFPEIPPAVVRRAVVVLLLLASVSGLVFNAFALVLPKLMQERMASTPDLLELVGFLAFIVTLFGGLTQFLVGRVIDRHTLRGVFLPLALLQLPCLVGMALVSGWPVLVLSALMAASIFGQVTVNETMTARYVAPALRAKMYSVRFTIGFLGSAAASPLIGLLHDATGTVVAPLLVLAGFGALTTLCALAFPNRREELRPELWAEAPEATAGRGLAAAE